MNLLVTGGNGFVAGSIIRQASPNWEVHVLTRGEAPMVRPGLQVHQLDLRDTHQLADIFVRVRPDAVIHTAAVADIDFCESHPTEAGSVNVGLTRCLAGLCAACHARLVFCSTDTVFGGEDAPYDEKSTPGPLNCYALTKVQAEDAVRQSGAQSVVARLALVVGLPVLGVGNSFLAKMLAKLRAGERIEVPFREIRTPIDVITLGRALLELAESNITGTIHLAGNESISRFDMALRIASRFGLDSDLVAPCDTPKIPGRAPRPRDVSLSNARARAELRTPMHDLADALNIIVQTSGKPAS